MRVTGRVFRMQMVLFLLGSVEVCGRTCSAGPSKPCRRVGRREASRVLVQCQVRNNRALPEWVTDRLLPVLLNKIGVPSVEFGTAGRQRGLRAITGSPV